MSEPDNSRKVVLNIDGRPSPTQFVSGVTEFFAIVKAVARNVTGRDAGIGWAVSVAEGSNLIIAEGEPAATGVELEDVYQTVGAFNSGMDVLRRGTVEPPRYFANGALERVRKLATLGARPQLVVEVGANGNRIPVGSQVLASVGNIQGKLYSAIGSVEGQLQTLSDRGKIHFYVFDSLRDKRVICTFDDELTDQAMSAWRKRVSVSGVVTYRENGIPVRVKVHHIRVFRDPSELPPPQSVRGIFKRSI